MANKTTWPKGGPCTKPQIKRDVQRKHDELSEKQKSDFADAEKQGKLQLRRNW